MCSVSLGCRRGLVECAEWMVGRRLGRCWLAVVGRNDPELLVVTEDRSCRRSNHAIVRAGGVSDTCTRVGPSAD